jgi:putative endonuclease
LNIKVNLVFNFDSPNSFGESDGEYKNARLGLHADDFEETNDIHSALGREKQLKKWRREKKDFLVNQNNSKWHDLSELWY